GVRRYYAESFSQPRFSGIRRQHLLAETVHRADLLRPDLRLNINVALFWVAYSKAHVSGGLAGESDNRNLIGRSVLLFHKPFRSQCQGVRLASARSGQ